MTLALRRVILFVDDIAKMTDFYEKKLGLTVVGREDDFIDFDAGGGCRLALHSGVSNPGRTKVCFYAADVVKARQELIDRGIKMGKPPAPSDSPQLCDGKDPEGNPFQISNRK